MPELSESETTWPYALIGVAFAIYGIALFLEGTARGLSVRPEDRASSGRRSTIETALAVAGPVLGVVVIAMIAFAG